MKKFNTVIPFVMQANDGVREVRNAGGKLYGEPTGITGLEKIFHLLILG